MSMNFKRKLPIPMEVKEKYPVPESALKIKADIDAEISDIFFGKSDKLLLVCGPCSADREDAVLEYCYRICSVSEKVKDKLIIVPRVYTNKPRTTGYGYKGMIHQPDPNGKPDPFNGILKSRDIHARVLKECGMPTADELLYPANFRYLSDLISYVAVGARSCENQEHRLVASGISVPVGFKNPISGNLDVLVNSVSAADTGHSFVYRGWDVETTGNPLSHAVLRGFEYNDCYQPNYDYDSLKKLHEKFLKSGLDNKSVIIDLNHANSGKDCFRQPEICFDVIDSMRSDDDLRKFVKGFMIESYLVDGSQEIGPDEVYGKSITDPCLGIEKTEKLILNIADRI